MTRRPGSVVVAAAIAAALASGACGKGDGPGGPESATPSAGRTADDPRAAETLGFPTFATKNTTRVGGADPVADAAGVALAAFPGTAPASRPTAVVLADAGSWQTAIAAAALAARPVRAPVLLADGAELPEATAGALERLAPTGSAPLDGAQLVAVGDVPAVAGLRTRTIAGADPFATAAAVDATVIAAAGRASDAVVVASAADGAAAYAMPAAGWAAKSGDPVLFVERDAVPAATADALRRHRQPSIYVLGGRAQVSDAVVERLGELGHVRRIAAPTPEGTAIAFARFLDGDFGWAVREPGHGVVFANPGQPSAAAAAAPLSASGSYGPLLLTDVAGGLPDPVVQFLLDIQPGYAADPVRGVYNHGWLIGDERAVTAATQARIDALLEISPVSEQAP